MELVRVIALNVDTVNEKNTTENIDVNSNIKDSDELVNNQYDL